jgi:DNA-binding SARP family transcriptional activator
LRVYLFGPLRVYQQGVLLPNTAEVWRSAKTRSLLACLALSGERGVTQTQIVDALWPLRSELDGDAERRSLTAFRSYLSTLRSVLEPGAPRGSECYVIHDGSRYCLRRDDGLWVDAWAFEAAASRAEAAIAAGRSAAGLASWEEALNLYPQEGLLPDETHLLPEFLEPVREQFRRRWLRGLRQMARAAETLGQHERAAALRGRLAAADVWDVSPR